MKNILLVIFLSLIGQLLLAHGDVHERIGRLSRQIKESPDDMTLYMERGLLYNIHESFDSAVWDFQVVLREIPDFYSVHLCLAEAYLGQGAADQSLSVLEEYTEMYREHYRWFYLRGKANMLRGYHREAARDFEMVLRLKKELTPQDYLDYAAALKNVDPDGCIRAIAELDAAEATLGWVITIKQYALELELERQDYEQALVRIREIGQNMERKEKWLAKMGMVLSLAGRHGEAVEAYQQALVAIAGLTPAQRETASVKRLEKSIIEAIKKEFTFR